MNARASAVKVLRVQHGMERQSTLALLCYIFVKPTIGKVVDVPSGSFPVPGYFRRAALNHGVAEAIFLLVQITLAYAKLCREARLAFIIFSKNSLLLLPC